MNVPVCFPALTVDVTENPQVETWEAPNPLCVCRIKEVAVLHSLKRRGLGLVVKPWDVAQLMLKVIWSLALSWSSSCPYPVLLRGAPGQERPGMHHSRGMMKHQAFKGDNTAIAVAWIAPVERH